VKSPRIKFTRRAWRSSIWSDGFEALTTLFESKGRRRLVDINGTLSHLPSLPFAEVGTFVTLYLRILDWEVKLASLPECMAVIRDKSSDSLVRSVASTMAPLLVHYDHVRSMLERSATTPPSVSVFETVDDRLPLVWEALAPIAADVDFVSQRFSSCFALSFSLHRSNEFGRIGDVYRITSFLENISRALLTILSMGIPVRGAIELGVGSVRPMRHRREPELLSASMLKAYQLEQRDCRYPRVIVGPDLTAFCAKEISTPRDESDRELRRALAARLALATFADSDGTTTLDYLNSETLSSLGSDAFVYLGCYASWLNAALRSPNEVANGEAIASYKEVVAYYKSRISQELIHALGEAYRNA
jgi:hypothetical protein